MGTVARASSIITIYIYISELNRLVTDNMYVSALMTKIRVTGLAFMASCQFIALRSRYLNFEYTYTGEMVNNFANLLRKLD